MRTLQFAISLICYNVLLAQHASEQFKSEIEKARFLIEAHKEMTNVPGAQVAVMIDGELVWSESFGYSNIEQWEPVTTDTKFRIASVSKSVTSMAMGQLIESGQLNIDEDIRTYVPQFPKKSYSISARQLAASVSGIRHYNQSDPKYRNTNYPSVVDALDIFEDEPLVFEPNTDYLYSSYGWVLLSAAMQQSADRSFFELMENTWDELGMVNTSFDYPDKEIPNKSTFYVKGKKDHRVEAPLENRSYMYAGGGYLSTAEDLVKMGHQLITDQFISAETRSALASPHVLENGDSTYYGLGWETGKSRLGVPIIYHGGSMQSARSHLVIYPDQKVVFAYLANTGDQIFFNDREAQSVAEIFVEKMMKSNDTDISYSIEGNWEIETTSLRNKTSKGSLSISDGRGSITFRRSKKEKSFPVIIKGNTHDSLHLIAVSPMFIDFYLKLEADEFEGNWLHDFNVKGIPESDEYWNAREIVGERVE